MEGVEEEEEDDDDDEEEEEDEGDDDDGGSGADVGRVVVREGVGREADAGCGDEEVAIYVDCWEE